MNTKHWNKKWGSHLFPDTAFDLLMERRILHVLLICSKYNAFMLEEDGRIEEQIFNEYISLNLRYPPKFIHVTSASEAFDVLKSTPIDLVVTMLDVQGMDPFALANRIKESYPQKPIVALTPFSREVALRFERENMSAFDYAFAWLGNAQIMLAIIKLIEDSMNCEHDVGSVGVQTILLVEDSIRYYSSYLPIIYRILLMQSKDFMSEGLNEHQMMMRLRGRPKILLARTFEEAEELYQKYKHNMLGVITDMSYPHRGQMLQEAGLELIKMVKRDDPNMPMLIQSSEIEYQSVAKEYRVGFLHKYSKFLSIELEKFIYRYMAFGDFIFVEPETGKEIMRAADLKELQKIIFNVPDQSLQYHIQRNHIAKWLTARALFPIADVFKRIGADEFVNLDEARQFIYDTIVEYRHNKGRGIIAQFRRESYDGYQIFARIGNGSLGGKGRGLAFFDWVVKHNKLTHKFENVFISIPRTVVLCTDIFEEFMEANLLYPTGLSDLGNGEILERFLRAPLPTHVLDNLGAFIAATNHPIAIRSSSLLEDSHYQPFAGIYSTYMIPNVPDNPDLMLVMLEQAIKSVYASVYYLESKAYMQATNNSIDEERMAVVLQEVIGTAHGNRFYPTFSGVARSLNYYTVEPEKPTDGIASIALGLGKHVVEGRPSLRFVPKYPKKLFQLSSPDIALKETQKSFFSLDLRPLSFKPSTDEGVNLFDLDIREAHADGTLQGIASVFDYDSYQIRDGYDGSGTPIVSFSNILLHNQFPLSEILNTLLNMGQKEMNNPVEIEFAVDLNPPEGGPKTFGLLQIRPIVQNREVVSTDFDSIDPKDCILTTDSVLGNGIVSDIMDLIYIKPNSFDPSETLAIASELEQLNRAFLQNENHYVLIGPGRWGSSDRWLGVPIKWPQISGAKVIVESGMQNYNVDPSQGTHFFQNLTSLNVAYLTVNPHIGQGAVDYAYLDRLPASYESKMVRHVRFKSPITVIIHGQKRMGVILRPKA